MNSPRTEETEMLRAFLRAVGGAAVIVVAAGAGGLALALYAPGFEVLGGITAGGCVMAAVRWWRGSL
jgi:hypothetical protein